MDSLTKRAAEQQEVRECLVQLIRKHLFTSDSSISDCAERMRSCLNALYRGTEDPDGFSMSELSLIQMTLGIPQNELIEAVQPFIGREIA